MSHFAESKSISILYYVDVLTLQCKIFITSFGSQMRFIRTFDTESRNMNLSVEKAFSLDFVNESV